MIRDDRLVEDVKTFQIKPHQTCLSFLAQPRRGGGRGDARSLRSRKKTHVRRREIPQYVIEGKHKPRSVGQVIRKVVLRFKSVSFRPNMMSVMVVK